MKKSLESLKEKFGKFELSKEQKNAVTGGFTHCVIQGRDGRLTRVPAPPDAVGFCDNRPSCVGCF